MTVLLNLTFARWKKRRSDGLAKGLSAETLTMVAPPRVEWKCLGVGAPKSHRADSCGLRGNVGDDNDKRGTVMPRGRAGLEDHKSIQFRIYSPRCVSVQPAVNKEKRSSSFPVSWHASSQSGRSARYGLSGPRALRWCRRVSVSNQRIDSPCYFMIGLRVQIITSLSLLL